MDGVLPARALHREGHPPAKPAVWWQLWRGASAARRNLEAGSTTGVLVSTLSKASFLRPSGVAVGKIGHAPGLYETPQVEGVNWGQVVTTLSLGTFALAVGYLILGK